MSDTALDHETTKAADIVRRGEWAPEEYEAGYRARMDDAPASLTATACWRIGWQEAERELTETLLRREPHANSEWPPASWKLDWTDLAWDGKRAGETKETLQ